MVSHGAAKLALWAELGAGRHRACSPRCCATRCRDRTAQAERVNRELLEDTLALVVAGWSRRRADLEWARSARAAMTAKVRDGLGHGVGPSA